MVGLVSKVSKGSKMDQVYLPKNREDLVIGSYVVVKSLETVQKEIKPYFYGIRYIEPVKIKIINEIFKIIEKEVKFDNVIITGSFLERGFKFNDIDIIVVSDNNINNKHIEEVLKNKIGAESHVIIISNKALGEGFSTDPLYKLMLTKCVSRNRFIYNLKQKINYKLLDLHLLKSKLLIDNFEILNGDEKYELVRNLIAIWLFIDKKEITKDKVDLAINKVFGNKTVEKLKENMVKKDFLVKYTRIYRDIQNKILKSIENESKQK